MPECARYARRARISASFAQRALVLVLACATVLPLGGCSGTTANGATAKPPPRLRPPLSAVELQALVRDVAQLRGLPEKSPIPIERLDRKQFAAAVRAREVSSRSAEADAQSKGFLVAWNLAPPAGAAAASTMSEVLEEQVIGFYDPTSRRVFVRGSGDLTEENARKERAVLAHEVEHALQAQNFSIPDLDALPFDDMRLAYLSVLEGDAMVSMAAYLGAENGAPVRRVLRRIQDLTREMPIDDMLRNDGHSSALLRALPVARERLAFPYYAGMSFMSDMYRAGGFPLVNHVFSQPPQSSEQILHPLKYLAGEAPVPVRAPDAPPGYRVLATERMGELLTRVVLSSCLNVAAARQAAEGWGGDAFSVVMAPDAHLALLWSTVWDSAEEAAEFERALLSNPACWKSGGLGSSVGELRIGGAYKVIRDGAKVAFARGLPEPQLSLAAAELLKKPGAAPPAKPVGPYIIPQATPIPRPYRGTIQGGVYHSHWLGLTALLPGDLVASVRESGADLSLGRPGVPIGGFVVLSERLATPAWNDRTLYEIGGIFARELEDRRLVPVAGGERFGALGPAVERTWQIEGSQVQVRAVLVPVCGGNGSYVFIQLYANPEARQMLDFWLNSFRYTGPVRPPVCDLLDPP